MLPPEFPFAPPEPVAAYRGRLAPAWGWARTGRLRQAAATLCAVETASLTPVEEVQRAALTVTCQLGLGDLAAATAAGEALRPALTLPGAVSTLARLAHGDLATAAGDHAQARDHYLAAGTSPAGEDVDLAPWRAGAALALVRIGDRTEAARLAREQLTLAEHAADPHPLAWALRTLATADAGVDPVRTLQRASGLALHSNDLRLAAQIKTDLAGLLLLSAHVPSSDAMPLLREAETFATAEGLWPLHARIARLLVLAGEQTKPLSTDSLAILTTAEKRIAHLASQGLTNRQIAEELTVTVKGVEWHLSRVYRKLGVGSRHGLSALLDTRPAEPAQPA